MIRISRTIPRRYPFTSSSPSRTSCSKSGVTRTPCPYIAKRMLSPPNSSPVSAGSDVPKCIHPLIRRGKTCFNSLPALTAKRRISSMLSLSTAFILANILLIDKKKFFILFHNCRHFSKKEFFDSDLSADKFLSTCFAGAFPDTSRTSVRFADVFFTDFDDFFGERLCFFRCFLRRRDTEIPAILSPFRSGLSVSKRS